MPKASFLFKYNIYIFFYIKNKKLNKNKNKFHRHDSLNRFCHAMILIILFHSNYYGKNI